MSPAEQAASELAASASYFCASFNAARDAMVVFNDDRHYVAANPAACQLLGVDPDGLNGRRIDEFVPPALSGELDADWASFLTTGHHDGEYELLREDAASVTVEYTATARIAPGYHLALFRDVTERKQREELLARKHRQLVEAQTVAKIGSWELDPATNTIEWSDELHRIFGVEPGTVTSLETVRELVHPDDRALLDAVVQTALLTHEPFTWECRTAAVDGTARVLESRGRSVLDSDGKLVRMQGTAQDVTERNRAMEAQAAAHDEAVEASRLKSEFMANMNHELRTPLNGVLGLASLLADTNLDDEQREYLKALHASGEALLAVIADVLDFAKIEAGKVDLEEEPFDLRTMVKNVCAIVAASAPHQGVDLAWSMVSALPPIVHGDANRIRQVLTNLASNAIKFTPAGKVTVRVAGEYAPDALRLRFEVTDAGIGIDPHMQALIFEPFVQVDGSSSRRYGGTGLGLTIAKQLVARMGGDIGVESVPGSGSTFWFTVPVQIVTARAGHTATNGTPHSESALVLSLTDREGSRSSADTRRVLVVEDNVVNRLVAVRMLQLRGFAVDVAGDGLEALNMHRDHDYDAIFMDCQMPRLDGYEATREIRRRECDSRHTLIIAMTAHTMPGDDERCRAAGMDYYAGKPIKVAALDYIVSRVLHV